jgi:iron complex outermembrane recepter protein
MATPATPLVRPPFRAVLFWTVFSLLMVPLFARERPVTRAFDIPGSDAVTALKRFTEQSGNQVIFLEDALENTFTPAIKGEYTPSDAMQRLLAGTGLKADRDEKSGSFAVTRSLATPRDPNVERAPTSRRGPESNGESPITEKKVELPVFEVMAGKVLNMDIKRSRDDAQPYVVFDRTRMSDSGAPSIGEFLKQRLPSNSTSTTGSQTTAAASGGDTSRINLHGLGINQTLVLIDGHRAAGNTISGTPGQADINGIPISAVERIEILPATASGIYGGGATGGVVNIVLRRDYAGVEARATYDNTFDTDSGKYTAELSGGMTLEGGKTTVMLSALYQNGNAVSIGDRDLLQRGVAHIIARDPNFYYGSSPPLAATPNIRSANGTNLVLKNGTPLNSPVTFVPDGYLGRAAGDGGAALVGNAGRFNLTSPENASHTGTSIAGTRAPFYVVTERQTLLGTLRRSFTPWLQTFVDLRFENNRSPRPFGTNLVAYQLSASAPTNPFQQDIMFTMTAPGSDGSTVQRNRKRHLVAGIMLKLPANWTATIDYTWDENRISYKEWNSNLGGPTTAPLALVTAIAAGEIDPLRDTRVYPVNLLPYQWASGGGPNQTVFNGIAARVGGSVMQLPAGPATLTSLIEHRGEKIADSATYSLRRTPIFFFVPWREQLTDSASVEANVPLLDAKQHVPGVEALDLQFAARHDRYETHGVTAATFATTLEAARAQPITRATNKVSSTDYTTAIRWRVSKDLMVRTSFSTGFLPPSVSQILPNPPVENLNMIVGDPRRGGTSYLLPIDVGGGNPNLKPETSTSWTAGAVFAPRWIEGLRLSVDYLRLKKKDNIFGISNQQLHDNEAIFPNRIVRGPNLPGDPAGWAGPIIFRDWSLMNIATAEFESIDVQADYTWITNTMGRVEFYALAAWNTKFDTQLLPTVPRVQNIGIPISQSSPLRFRANGGIKWVVGSWSAGLAANYYSSYFVADPAIASNATVIRRQGNNGEVSDQIYFDVSASYRARPEAGKRWTSDYELSIGVRNILNTKPPVDTFTFAQFTAFSSAFGDARLATYYISLRKKL